MQIVKGKKKRKKRIIIIKIKIRNLLLNWKKNKEKNCKLLLIIF